MEITRNDWIYMKVVGRQLGVAAASHEEISKCLKAAKQESDDFWIHTSMPFEEKLNSSDDGDNTSQTIDEIVRRSKLQSILLVATATAAMLVNVSHSLFGNKFRIPQWV